MSRGRSRTAAIFVAVFAPLAAPALSQITDAQEVEIGTKLLAELEASGKVSVVLDSQAAQRLQELGYKVEKAAGRPGLGWAGGWQWLAARFAERPNAMALPGGFVLVDERLVEQCRNDDELAFVLAHEAGHIVGRHALRTLAERGTPIVRLPEELEWFRSLIRGDLAYGRKLELEADERALAIMQRAGFDPRHAILWMARMNDDTDWRIVLERVFGDHPPLTDRINHAEPYRSDVLEKGPFLAFVRDYALWVSRWDGTEQRKTSVSHWEIDQLRWGPSGDALAVVSDGDIYLVSPRDLTVTRLTASGNARDVAWAPGGDKIACVSNGDIYVISGDGREKRRLTTTRDCHSPAWSPAADTIAFCRQETRDVTFDDKGLWMVGASGTKARQVALGTGPWGPAIWPEFSPDGNRIAWAIPCQGIPHFAVDLRRESLPSRRQREFAEGADGNLGFGGGRCWSPGGQHLLLWNCWYAGAPAGEGLCRYGVQSDRLESPAALRGLDVIGAVPSPDWTQLAMLASKPLPGRGGDMDWPHETEFWVADWPGLSCRKLSVVNEEPLNCRLTAWVPDGAGVVAVTEGFDEAPDITWLVPTDGSRWRKLGEGGSATLSCPWPYTL